METGYPTLRRPKRKLCYATNTESLSKQWAGALSLGDVDKMFDDLDPSSHCDEDPLPPTPLLQISDSETNEIEKTASSVPQEGCQMGPEGDVLHPATRSPSPKLDTDLDIPFKAHAPVKTSSPIERNMVVEGGEELDNEKDQVVSPILFPCEDEEKEGAKTEPSPTLKPQCNGHIIEQSDDSELESPPSKIALSNPKMSNRKNKAEASCKESRPVQEKAPKKTQRADLEGKRKAPMQDDTEPPVSAKRQQPEVAAPKKKSESVHRQPAVEVSTRAGQDMTTFLQKLRDACQPKPACSTKPLSPVKVPTAPEPEDEFLILEDDSSFWFSIPSKTATSKKPRQTKTSSSDKDSSTDKGTKHSRLETAQKQQESEHTNSKLGSQSVDQKIKKMKGKEKKKKVAEPENDVDELCTPLDPPAGDLMEQEKTSKRKQRLKKVPSKESDEGEEQLKGTASREAGDEQPTQKKEKNAGKFSALMKSKSLKDGNENAATSKTKSLKGGRKVIQGSGAVNETVKGQSQSNKEDADAEDLGSLSDKDIMNSEAQVDEKDKQNKLPVVSEESSSQDSLTVGKRRRKQTGQWWLTCPQSTEETEFTDNRPTLKKAKQSKKEPTTAGPSPVKTKKDSVLKKRKQAQPALSSSKNTNEAKEKKIKQNKKRNTKGGEMVDKMKVSESVFCAIEAEPIEEQQLEVLDQDPVELSPLVLAHRDLSQNSGDQVFQRVYHHVSNEKMSTTPGPISPRGPREQLGAAESEKRRRKPPGSWWAVDSMSEDVEVVSSQPQQQESKPHKERKKQPKRNRSPGLGTPKNGNMLVSPEPHGGAPVSPLKAKLQLAPKTVKRSLATFKDIFSSVTESPSVVSRRGADQNNKHEVTERPAVEVTVTDCSPLDKSDGNILSMDAGEDNSPSDHVARRDSKSPSENTLKPLTSGPASMIELEPYDDDDDMILPSSRSPAVLSASDLCGPPLKPLILQPKDKGNLTEWFKSLWSTTLDNGPEITPDQFDWYFYKGRAMGVLLDLNCGSFCNGKILLGSYMKKPLWVDHSATTVFNLLTSSVRVTINCSESLLNAGQSFMVPCGHAYSLQNLTAQPAALYFTRMLAETD